MRKAKSQVGKSISFLQNQPPHSYFGSGMKPPAPFMGPGPTPPFFGGQNPGAPFAGGSFSGPPAGFMGPGQPPGLGGLLQGLLGGNGSIDLPNLLANAQKVIGAVNQAGEVVKNISPMLQLLRNVNLSDLTSTQDDTIQEVSDSDADQKTVKKKRKKRKKRKSIKK